MKFIQLKRVGMTVCCSMILLTNDGFAQEADTSTSAAQNISTLGLEEIVVTAQKREQLLKDVPVSLEVISGDVLESLNIQNGFDLIKYLPGFGIDDDRSIRTSTLKTRGIGTFTNSIGIQSSNLLVVDGEVLPRQSMLNLAVSDLERVEALRGPQGTLFGQNTSTGLIHYITKQPELDELNGKVRLQVTDYDGIDLRGHINVPLSDRWALRVNAQKGEVDGWVRNDFPGEENRPLNAEETEAIRAQLLYEGDNDFTAKFRADYSLRDTTCCSFTRLGAVPLNFGPRPIINVRADGTVEGTTYNSVAPESTFQTAGVPVTSRASQGNFGSAENFGFSAALSWNLGGNMSLDYNGSYRDFELLNSATFFTLQFPIERQSFGGNESVQFNQQEIRLSSYGNDKLDWVVGLFYHDTDGQRSEVRDGCIAGRRGLIENGVFTGCYSARSTLAFLDNFNQTGIDDRSILVPDRLLTGGDFTSNFENLAVFGQLEYNITDRLNMTLGFRALREESFATFSRTELATPSNGVGLDRYEDVLAAAQTDPSIFLRNTAPTKFSNSDTDSIYKAVLGYDFTEDIRGYINYSTGYKGASYFVTANTDPSLVDNFPASPEKSTNFEIGLRSRLFNDRLLFNFTYFDMSVEDFQVRAVRVFEDSNLNFGGLVNANEARTNGIEADLIYKVSESIEVSASYADFSAVFEDFAGTPINCPRNPSGGPRGGALADRCSIIGGAQFLDQTGLPFPNNSEQQFLGSVTHKGSIGDWLTNVQAVWRYNSEATQSINELAFEQASNPSNGTWDLLLGMSKGNIQANFFVKNVFDKTYTTRSNTNLLGLGTAFFPRDFQRYIGGSVQYSF